MMVICRNIDMAGFFPNRRYDQAENRLYHSNIRPGGRMLLPFSRPLGGKS